jgi:hypothetical protein
MRCCGSSAVQEVRQLWRERLFYVSEWHVPFAALLRDAVRPSE